VPPWQVGVAPIAGKSGTQIYLIVCDSAKKRVCGAAPDGNLGVPRKESTVGLSSFRPGSRKKFNRTTLTKVQGNPSVWRKQKKEGVPGDQ